MLFGVAQSTKPLNLKGFIIICMMPLNFNCTLPTLRTGLGLLQDAISKSRPYRRLSKCCVRVVMNTLSRQDFIPVFLIPSLRVFNYMLTKFRVSPQSFSYTLSTVLVNFPWVLFLILGATFFDFLAMFQIIFMVVLLLLLLIHNYIISQQRYFHKLDWGIIKEVRFGN